MALVELKSVTLGFGHPSLIENVSFQIEKGERIGLIGRNGTGKSTLMRVINGLTPPDSGEILRQGSPRIAALEQDIPPGENETIFDVVASGLGPMGITLARYNRLSREMAKSPTSELSRRHDRLQQELEAGDGWDLIRRVEETLSRMNLNPKMAFPDLSAGMKRRTLFAKAIASSPDLLLLDEPTNHLDIDAILWMEAYLLRYVPTLLFVTHDRTFLQKISTRILELDRGSITSYACGYGTYLGRRTAMLEAEETRNALFDKKLSQEEAWIRQGIKARRTRNEGRVRALKKMRAAAGNRRKKTGTATLDLQEARRSGKLVIEASGIEARHDGRPFIREFSTTIMRGDKIGIIGPNGVGKTTLLNILLKNQAPDAGSVRHGTNLQVAYFDQLRTQLQEERTVRDNIVEGNDFIVYNGEKRHVITHLRDFLFSPERCNTPVHVLSGGEKNRLLLAKLFTRPANMLVLDEPTNDLDAETLELLEDLLFNFAGTLLLVSHDRSFLNNVVTSTVVYEGDGILTEYAGGYDDWLTQRPEPKETPPPEKKAKKPSAPPPKPLKLGYMEGRELKSLPKKIERLETRQQELYDAMADPAFYRQDKGEIARIQSELESVEHGIETAYQRWEALESKNGGE